MKNQNNTSFTISEDEFDYLMNDTFNRMFGEFNGIFNTTEAKEKARMKQQNRTSVSISKDNFDYLMNSTFDNVFGDIFNINGKVVK